MNYKNSEKYWENLPEYALKKKDCCFPEKIVDINDCWWIFKDSFPFGKPGIWFDKHSYSFVFNRDLELQENKPEKYISCFQYDPDELYKIYASKIDNKEVNEYFYSVLDEEERRLRFRKFVDWNCIDITYDRYLETSKRLIKWCIDNDINYKFRKVAPPSDYIFINDDYKLRKWQIPM